MKTINQLASEFIGSSQRGNKYFVTIGYGWYLKEGADDMEQVENSFEPTTMLFETLEQAEDVFDAINPNANIDKVKPSTIGQVFIEDKSGTLKEKRLVKSKYGTFYTERF